MNTAKKYIIGALVFLFPLFFLPLTQEYYVTNKLYLLVFGVLALLAIVTINFILTKMIVLRKTVFDAAIFFVLVSTTISLLLMSPNKIGALLNPLTGASVLYALAILYIIVTQSKLAKNSINNIMHNALAFSSIVLSVVAIIFFFNPFKGVTFPLNLQFLSNPLFTPIGITYDLALFLGFFVVQFLVVTFIANKDKKDTNPQVKKTLTFNTVAVVVTSIALALTIYTLVKPMPVANSTTKTNILSTLPPYGTSWYAAVDTLKSPLTALFGVGPDNFTAAWTRSKTADYNKTAYWQTNFDRSASFMLHILTVYGIVGLVAFILLIVTALKSVKSIPNLDTRMYLFASLAYLVGVMVILPPSFPILFLFFIVLIQIANQHRKEEETRLDLTNLLPIVLGIALLSFLLIAVVGYFYGRFYVAEYYFKKSLNSFSANNARDTYLYQQKAIITNSNIERYRVNFSQLNMLLANNLAASKKDKLTDQDKQNINQAIQAAISEAKAAVALNPQLASNWENLAIIYRNILNVAQGADGWTVSAYQRAILLDPVNPSLRLNLGGVFYSLKSYSDASKVFEQAVSLKPDWSNAHYNLAWASYQLKDYQRAVQEMQSVITLLNDPKSADSKLAQKDLDQFKKSLPKDQGSAAAPEATPSAKPQQLTLPTPAASISPKIELPNTASPEANPKQ